MYIYVYILAPLGQATWWKADSEGMHLTLSVVCSCVYKCIFIMISMSVHASHIFQHWARREAQRARQLAAHAMRLARRTFVAKHLACTIMGLGYVNKLLMRPIPVYMSLSGYEVPAHPSPEEVDLHHDGMGDY